MHYRKKKISRELYDWCLKEKYADAALIAKWKKAGYERLCCLRCIQTRDHNFGSTCICRVPSDKLEEGKIVECLHLAAAAAPVVASPLSPFPFLLCNPPST